MFFTGKAGTGKTFMVERIVRALRARYDNPAEFRKRVAITATTGIAATHIGGQMLNTAIGVGAVYRLRDFETMTSPRSRRRLKDLHVLLVDECSMPSAEMILFLCVRLRFSLPRSFETALLVV